MLALPAGVPYAAHVVRAGQEGLLPTGFLVYDLAFYMAVAREHFDGGGFRLLYGLPFSPFASTPAIYFQPHTLVLGLLWRATGWDPGVVFVVFGAATAWVCARLALALYREVAGLADTADRVGLLVFCWGGGLLVLAGLLAFWGRGGTVAELLTFEPLFTFDPWDGWWFLSFGRNLVLPTEAGYHALFFGVVLGVLRRRYRLAAALALVLVLTHPFTGAELTAILLAWLAVEGLRRSRAVPREFALACVGVAGVQAAYYGVFLRRFEEHRVVLQQYDAEPWLLDNASLLPAYLPVLCLAAWNFRSVGHARRYLATPPHRLLLVWFLVALALEKHELVMRPVMPLHFTRGYVWTALCLMGAPVLVGLLRRLATGRRRVAGIAAAAGIVVLFLADNGSWVGTYPWRPSGWRQAIYLHPAERDVLAHLAAEGPPGSVVAAQTRKLGFLTTVYTPLRSWYAHHLVTPYAEARAEELRRYFAAGSVPPAWRDLSVLVVMFREEADRRRGQGEPLYANAGFVVFRAGRVSAR